MKAKKRFDCVEMQHQGGNAIYEVIKDMTREEQLAYWARRTEALRKKQEALRRRAAKKTA